MFDEKVRSADQVPVPLVDREILWLSATGWMRRQSSGDDVALGAPVPAVHQIGASATWVAGVDIALAAAGMPGLVGLHAVFIVLVCQTANGSYAPGDKVRFPSSLNKTTQTWGSLVEVSGAVILRLDATAPRFHPNDGTFVTSSFAPTLANWSMEIYGVW